MSEPNEYTITYELDGQEIKLTFPIVQNFVVSGNGQITLQEYKAFTELCKCRKLNPFLKEAYLIKFGNAPAQIVVGKDAVFKKALRNPNYNGLRSGIIVKTKNGEIIERKGCFYDIGTEQLVGGWAEVYRKDIEYPTYCSVAFSEVAQTKAGGSLNSNWATKGATMVEKVAKVRALRDTFMEDLGGMYEPEEVGKPEPEQEVIQQDEPTETENKEISMSDL